MKAIEDAENGLIDADLGGNVIKQRIARTNQGKSGGYRTIIIFKKDDKAFFMHGYAKSSQSNITKREEKDFKSAAKIYLNLTDEQIENITGVYPFLVISLIFTVFLKCYADKSSVL